MELFVAGCSTSWTERYNSCYMIDGHILFDVGGGTPKNLVKHFGEEKIKQIDTIFISHFHGDHIFGLGYFISDRTRNPGKKKLKVISKKGIKTAIKALMPFCSTKKLEVDEFLDVVELKDQESIKIGKYKVTAHKLNHGLSDDLGFSLDDGKQIFGYTGDTAFDENLKRFTKFCDCAMCDVSALKNASNHMGAEGFLELQKMFPEKNLYAVHCTEPVFRQAKELKINILKQSKTYVIENKKLKLKKSNQA